MENYFENHNKKLCNGCGTCALKCPKNAIEMIEDDEGFLYPVINKTKCINCKICEKVCSNNNESKYNSDAYIAINNSIDELNFSSSGGVFYILARYTIENRGVVFGVTYDENLNAIHKYAETLSECKDFCGSKYVRSDLKDTYKEAKGFLDVGRIVLYTGTACQLNGLKKYLGKEYDNLILCDILCHANPSPKVFKLYKENIEKKYGKVIKNINFRAKETGWKNQVPLIEFTDGDKIEEYTYFNAFVKEMINRESCYNCVFASKYRITDFTIADFWGIEKIDNTIDEKAGVSLLLINSEKGKNIVNFIQNNALLRKVEFNDVLQYNHFKNVPMHKNRNKFFRKLKSNKINENNIIYYMNKYAKDSNMIRIKRKIKKILKNINN